MRKNKIRIDKNLIPVMAAACLFLISCVCAFMYVNSSEKQAEHTLMAVYTADSAWAAVETDSTRLELYHQKFDSLTTEKGREDLMQLQLPYGLMNKGKKVEKTYSELINLKPVKGIEVAGSSGKTQAFTYEIQTEIYFNKGNDVMQTVEKETYIGTVYMQKIGFLSWKLDGLTGRRTQ